MIKRFLSYLFINKKPSNEYNFHCVLCENIKTIELNEAPQSKKDNKGNLLFECYECYIKKG